MTVFDLLFLLSALATIAATTAVAISLLRGQRGRALRILKILGICVASYIAVTATVDFLKPQHNIGIGDPWCFDDWRVQVDSLTRESGGASVRYTAQLRIFSTVRGISQRALGAWIYLIDRDGHRFLPNADLTATPLTVTLAPEQSVNTARSFDVPADAHVLGLITGHGGAYCGGGVLIIGEGSCLFNRPTMVPFP